jgi:histidyl-tRNA synthetase
VKFRSIKGTRDILPGEVETWEHVESIIRRTMQIYNYREIRTPVFETTSLFSRSIGELTDIVSKEMYTFKDRSDESVTLRPEGTASVLRAFIQNNLGEAASLTKLYYLGPMFRQERPQAGRLRQFHQFGAEALGSQSPSLDVEMILLAREILRTAGVGSFELKVNSVGCQNCRPAYKKLLIVELKKLKEKLSPESQERIEKNPLRVLDSKNEEDNKLTTHVPLMKDHLCKECADHFKAVQSLLGSLSVEYRIDGRLVRGLDYYTKTAFEITSSALGSQDAIMGGGRYDLLTEELGGKATPGVGFAAGMERLIMAMEKGAAVQPPGPKLFLVGLDDASRSWTFLKACELRSQGISVETDYLGRSIKAQLREANRQQAEYVVVVGEQELQTKSVNLKEMKTGSERKIRIDEIASALR